MLQTLYRGTQRPTIEGALKGMSFTVSLPVAIIWSARPGDVWAHTPEQWRARFVAGSTVHIAQVDVRNPLDLGDNFNSLAQILRRLRYGRSDGITEEEARKIYNYLHNRLVGKAKGGSFLYKVIDEYDEPLDPNDVPLSLTSPYTLIRMEAEDWDYEPTLDTASRLLADTFVFADAPSVQVVAARLGYDVITYQDLFQACESAARELLRMDCLDLEGVDEERDLEDEFVPIHQTIRIIDPTSVVSVSAVPVAEAIAGWQQQRQVAGWYYR